MKSEKGFSILDALIVFILFLYSCDGKKANKQFISDNSPKMLSLNFLESALVDSLFFKGLQVVFLETNHSSFHKKVDKVFIDKDKIFVFDKSMSKVIVYDSLGRYLSNIHNIGRRPTEYSSVNDVFVDIKTKLIHLLCDYPFKIMSYNYDMQFVKETKIDNLYLEFVMEGDDFYCRQAETENNIVISIWI